MSTTGPPSEEQIRALLKENGGVVIFTCTWYKSTSDLRFNQCLETIQKRGTYPYVIVDDSPSNEVYEELMQSGAIVHRQKNKGGGKGTALREAADIASKLPGVTDETLLCWQEAEKSQMMECWGTVQKQCVGDDVVIPFRSQFEFQKCYPIEQFHSETFGNFYLDCTMNDAIKANPSIKPPRLEENGLLKEKSASKFPIPSVDWHFGPFAFRAKHILLWTEYDGTSYDAQLVPIVHAMRKGFTMSSVCVHFELDAKMKEQEEENVSFIEKRLFQLNVLDPKVKKAWTDDFYC